MLNRLYCKGSKFRKGIMEIKLYGVPILPIVLRLNDYTTYDTVRGKVVLVCLFVNVTKQIFLPFAT